MKQEKDQTRVMVEDLKKQMTIGLQSAVDKIQDFSRQLDAANAEKKELERQLVEARHGEVNL